MAKSHSFVALARLRQVIGSTVAKLHVRLWLVALLHHGRTEDVRASHHTCLAGKTEVDSKSHVGSAL